MTFRLFSDIHLEFGMAIEYFKVEPEEILILAGDIAVGAKKTSEALRYFANKAREVIYVPGNHEYYGSDFDDFNRDIKLLTEDITNCHVLLNETVKIDGTSYIGGTLWTNFREDPWAQKLASNNISDFVRINNFSTTRAVQEFQKTLDWIKFSYEENAGPKVIVTHFLPAIECIHPKYNRPNDLLNYYFANDLSTWIGLLEDTEWVFGHTHETIDIMIGNTRCRCNPYGYHLREINSLFTNI